MKALSQSLAVQTLPPPLDTLHDQSVEWKRQLQLWNDELTFFYHLLTAQGDNNKTPSRKLATAEKELIILKSDRLSKLSKTVKMHERHLAAVLKSMSPADEQVYREAHQLIKSDMARIERDFSLYRTRLFEQARLNTPVRSSAVSKTNPLVENGSNREL